MTKILVDENLRNRLENLNAELVFCDEAGRTLGYFVPADDGDAELYAWARSQFTDQELEVARQEAGGLVTDEVLRRLSDG